MYQAEPDPYCYSNSDVLKNKAGHTDPAALEVFETAMTFARADEPLPLDRLSVRHYCAVHHHLFQDVYDGPENSGPSGSPRTRARFAIPKILRRR